jgi:hypothetical protein
MPLPEFTMQFEPTTIEHLGLKLYVSLPPVISELVSNAWDADAEKIEISIPVGPIDGNSEVVVRDHGSGMDAQLIQDAYLRIGLNRRVYTGADYSPQKKRPIMGRKGLGKLAAFGIANQLEIRTVFHKNAICLLLDYEAMQQVPRGDAYKPKVIAERTGKTDEPNGTEIRIRQLRRQRAIDESLVRQELARRYTVIGEDFQVILNGRPIGYEDRRLKRACRKAWDLDEMPMGANLNPDLDWTLSGWIGLLSKSSQTDRGVDIFARGKAVELDTMFSLKTTNTQFARAYVVGEVTADFLDAERDNIATARNAVVWESAEGQALQNWGQAALKFIFEKWRELQQQEKRDRLVKTHDFEDWLKTRTLREQHVAERLIGVIISDDNIEPESAGPLLEIIKSNVEFQAFQELVDELEQSGANVATLLTLFDDWRILEAREHLRLADGRLEVMEKLAAYIQEGALEVQQIQPLFEQNGWLVDPTWGSVSGQTTYTQMLRRNCVEPRSLDEKDRRIDILGYRVGGSVQVVELKRPEKTLSREDLEQIERYVDWARANFSGTGPEAPKYINGLLIVGKLSSDAGIQKKLERLSGDDIRVCTYGDLLEAARSVYGDIENRLKDIAPEYAKQARRSRRKQRRGD